MILVLAVWRLDQDASLTIALSAPMLMVPYLGLYSAVPLVLAAWSIRRMERAVLPPLVLVAQPLALLFLPALAMLVMASGIALPVRSRWFSKLASRIQLLQAWLLGWTRISSRIGACGTPASGRFYWRWFIPSSSASGSE